MNLLIVVSAGKGSKHHTWFPHSLEDAFFDLMLLDYSGGIYFGNKYAKYYMEVSGTKFFNLAEALKKFPEAFENRDAIWLPDDDITISYESIKKFCNVFQDYGLNIAQPAIRYGSNGRSAWIPGKDLIKQVDYSWESVKWMPMTKLRYTNVVEIMMPMFAKSVFDQIKHTLTENKSGWGVDYLWAHILKEEKLAIVDVAFAGHMRPLKSGILYSKLSKSAGEEFNELIKRYNLSDWRPVYVIKSVPLKISKIKEIFWRLVISITRFLHSDKPRFVLLGKIYLKLKGVINRLKCCLFNMKSPSNVISENIYKGLKLLPEDYQGWHSNTKVFKTLIERQKPSLIIEVGSWKGASAIHMAKIIKEIGLDTKIYCIDTWLGALEFWTFLKDTPERNLMLKNGYPNIYYQFLSNVVHSKCQNIILPFPNTASIGFKYLKEKNVKAELIYIDASHEERDVYINLVDYSDLLTENGIIFGDDYSNETFPGVKKAVDRFCKEQKLDLQLSEDKIHWYLTKNT